MNPTRRHLKWLGSSLFAVYLVLGALAFWITAHVVHPVLQPFMAFAAVLVARYAAMATMALLGWLLRISPPDSAE